MLLSLDDIKARLGIDAADTTHDAALTAAGDIVTAWFEGYCQRGLEARADIEENFEFPGRREYLFRFPIDTITEALLDGNPLAIDTLFVNKAAGWIEPLPVGSHFYGCLFTVTYSGGFAPDAVPEDLADAFARCTGVKGGFGEGSAAGATPTAGAAPIKTLGLGQGAIAIGFETGSTAERGGITGGFDVSEAPPELQAYVGVLDRYRVLYL